ncbi:MAG: hypothetical protein EI684_12030 [Candidatus Viridilinea halotolerans]|uniref:Carboxypeptidase regulatory-like domain-containing protein n=1 Tax=Candidatus Viridilinea halotolerans TaxID=2491704 RepID=A0A426TYI6_9CHLR|nr:MAG: hypothetical protein EI684_12030 [Candidatus Viridilinea halotolerans]
MPPQNPSAAAANCKCGYEPYPKDYIMHAKYQTNSTHHLHRIGLSIVFIVLALLAGTVLLVISSGLSLARNREPTTLVSVASDGTQGVGGTGPLYYGLGISADGRYAAFDSRSRYLVPGDTNGVEDVFVHDLHTGETTRVSVASDGTQGNDISWAADISADGRYVVFHSFADNLVPGVRCGVFVHDRETSETTCVSVASDGTPGNGSSPSISADGRYVVFDSSSELVPGCGGGINNGIFIHDRETRETTCVSVASDGTPGDGLFSPALVSSISADGRYVVFETSASNLVPGDTNNATDIFVHDREQGTTTRIYTAPDDSTRYLLSSTISGNGRYIAYTVDSVFVYDQQTGATTLESVATDGTPARGSASSLSADGRYVAFYSSSSTIVPGYPGGVFVRDRELGETILVSSAPDGTKANGSTWGARISADGASVLFYSNASNLVAGDTNGEADAFVADVAAHRARVTPTPVDQARGSIAGTVTNLDGAGLSGIQVQTYRQFGSIPWSAMAATTTAADGSYRLENLLAGSYRVQFRDPQGRYRPEYYADASTLHTADTLTVEGNQATSAINASLDLAAPPLAQVATTRGSVISDPNDGTVTVAFTRSRRDDTTISTSVGCPAGTQPSGVTLWVGERSYSMSEHPAGSGVYQATLPENEITSGLLIVRWDCNGNAQEQTIGRIVLYDPSGVISDAQTGQPVVGAIVTLHRVSGALPDTSSEQRDCRTITTRQGDSWAGEPAATPGLGLAVNPELAAINGTAEISPTLNPQRTNDEGRYGWDVAEGCWYITVEAEGYETTYSPVVGVPDPVTDLDLRVTPSDRRVYLPLVRR